MAGRRRPVRGAAAPQQPAGRAKVAPSVVAGTSGAAGQVSGAAGSGIAGTGIAGTGSGSSGRGGSSGEAGAAGGPGAAGSSGNGGSAGTGNGRPRRDSNAAGNAGTGGSGTGGGRAGAGGNSGGCDWSTPDGKIVLFDGTSLSGWQNTNTGGPAQWRLVGDGTMEVVPMNSTNIQTTMKFDDLCLHIEYMTPMYPANVTGQSRGNSGIYFRRAYEMQVLDSYGQPPRDRRVRRRVPDLAAAGGRLQHAARLEHLRDRIPVPRSGTLPGGRRRTRSSRSPP